jgi:hypothetical protein
MFLKELMGKAYPPRRHIDWCFSIDEQRELDVDLNV